MYYPNGSPSIDFYEDAPQQPAQDCKQLFDQLFKKDNRNDDSFTVKIPSITYARKRQPLLNINNRYNDVSANEDDDPGTTSKVKKNQTKRAKPRKKKTNYPNCTKDALFEAYRKAIEMNQIPDFDKIEAEELNIVSEKGSSDVDSNDISELGSSPHRRQSELNDGVISDNEIEIINENENNLTLHSINNFNLNSTSNVISSTPNFNVIPREKRHLRDIVNINESTIKNTTNMTNITPFKTIHNSDLSIVKSSKSRSIIIPETHTKSETMKSFLTRTLIDKNSLKTLSTNKAKAMLSKSLRTNTSKLSASNLIKRNKLSSIDEILQICEYSQTISFEEYLSKLEKDQIIKIGEGTYCEVFLIGKMARKESCKVVKIIPFESTKEDYLVFILTELLILKTLNENNGGTMLTNFVGINQTSLVKGVFPERLCNEWNRYAKLRHTENSNPRTYDENKMYLCIEMPYVGVQLEEFKFKIASEALSAFIQIALSLAIAESKFEFEHRDLHSSNILIRSTGDSSFTYILNGKNFSFNPAGVFATIIDFTLSRLSKNKMVIYQDLAKDESLFEGQGNYQFEIYRMMRDCNHNNWELFYAKSNIFWLHYLADQLLNTKKYSSKSKRNAEALQILQEIYDTIHQFNSVYDFVNSSKFQQYLSFLK